MFPQRLPGKARKLTWGGALPTILDAIVDAIPEGGASPVAPEPAITIMANSLSEESINQAAEALEITVEELFSLPKQLVIKSIIFGTEYVLTRICYYENAGVALANFSVNEHYFNIIVDSNNNTVNAEYQ